MFNRTKETSRYFPSTLNAVNFQALHEIEDVHYIATVMNNGETRDEIWGDKDYSAEELESGTRKLYRIFYNTKTEKYVAVFCTTTDRPKENETSYYEQNDAPFLDDALSQFDPHVLFGDEFKDFAFEGHRKKRIEEVIIPIAEAKHYSIWPFSYWRRHHYVTLHLNLNEMQATFYDSKGTFLRHFYDISSIEDCVRKFQFSSVYKGQQSLLNEYDCGPWSHEYTRELITKGNVSHAPTLDRAAQKAAYNRFSEDEDAYDRDHKKKSSSLVKKAAIAVGVAALAVTVAVGIGALIYFTAGASIPLIVLAGAKAGVSLGFLHSMSTLAASATIGGIGAGVVAGATSIMGGIGYGCKKLFSYCRKPAPSNSQKVQKKDKGKEQEKERESSLEMSDFEGDIDSIPLLKRNTSTTLILKNTKNKPGVSRSVSRKKDNGSEEVELDDLNSDVTPTHRDEELKRENFDVRSLFNRGMN